MSLIYVRPAQVKDAPAILNIVNFAKQYLKSQHINQWQNNYPNPQSIKHDINGKACYVLTVNHRVAGIASLIPGPDKSYLKIQNGSWINGTRAPYMTIHRVAISPNFRGQGLSQMLMSNLITLAIDKGYHDIRIDTHPDNKGMQHIITKNGFVKRGIIHTLEGGKQANTSRYAYQLIIEGEK
ncbi:GNAT family N-acetyltransferase [Acetilactobacillus jinshanensis]|uniref:GNAT family N-acetyltransferase n=1 Tax=Acetilactobacillus jinshanensis TaxID=1720083 RepID=A0A4P6ZMU8_9LACO|nr:GNAT family N-acetyltransferase [Acetilactobacillus jinshanensis]QBP18947.1 GNAT family N-acetyltransferase [Acetilactobacillus jinshanensis]URL60503.1 GNAT family N-acetyltransferase [uncultured bacterium]